MLVFCARRMRLTLLVLIVIAVTDGKVTKKSQKEIVSASDETKPTKKILQKPAIIAIEIIDPNDNSTKSGKGKKRTIDSSLGYGYQNLFSVHQKPPKYEVYKYSQHDIPGQSHSQSHRTIEPPKSVPQHPDFQIQKSVQYDLGSTKPEYIPAPQHQNLQQYYQPGTTLFSTVDQNGHIGGLSSQAPHSNPGGMVPVIILRVYTNQLNQPGALHANIPQSHPYANLNTVDLQNLLAGYVQNQYQSNYQNQNYDYSEPQYQQQDTSYKQQGVAYQQQDASYQPSAPYQQQTQSDGLQTHENYPDDAHTKVIFHKDQKKTKTSSKVAAAYKVAGNTQKATPQKFKITIPANTYSKVEVQEHTYANEQPQQQQYYYQTPTQNQQYYQQDQYQYPEQYQDPKQYVQVATYPQQDQSYQYNQQYQEAPQQYVQYDSNYQEPKQAAQYETAPQYQQQQYVDAPYNQQQEQYSQDYNQPQQEYAQPQDYQQQQSQDYQQQEYAPQNHHEAQTSQDYNLQKTAAEVGRDLHSKHYNYHAHSIADNNQSSEVPARTHKARSTKKRRARVPLVLAPKIVEEEMKKDASLKSH